MKLTEPNTCFNCSFLSFKASRTKPNKYAPEGQTRYKSFCNNHNELVPSKNLRAVVCKEHIKVNE